jgi:preprotein translocase subunit YajC
MNHVLDFFPLLLGMPAGGTGSSSGGSGQLVTTIITFGLVIVIFYFLIIRPQSKKQKETKRMLSEIKKGDKVATIGGIRGTVETVHDETVVVKVADSTKLEFSKSAVSSVLEQTSAKKKENKEENTETQE